jgi:signal transduction histidine kinase/CheY-like chemotaxis protein/GAF domain-containing protein
MAADGQQTDPNALIADALDGIGQGVLIVGPDMRMVRGNRRFCELYGVGEETIRPGLHFAEHLRMMADLGLITGKDPDKQIADRLGSLAARRDFSADRRLPNGTIIHLTGHALPNGGYAFTFTDVTERTRQAEMLEAEVTRQTEQLRARESILRATLDHMQQGILVVDANFDVKALNDRLLDLFEVKAEVFANPNGFRRFIVHLAERGDYSKAVTPEMALERYASQTRLDEPRIFELHLPLGRVLEVRSSPLPSGGFVSTYTDITRRSRAETAMQQRDAVVSALNVASNTILASNDWRGPVERMLATLGQVTGVSSVYFARDYRTPDGHYKQEELFQWCVPGVSWFWDNPKLRTMTVKDDAFQDWRERRKRGETIQAVVRELEGPKREWLSLQDIKALVRLPVFVAGQWWGTIGFDDCFEERVWAEPEIEALRAAAALIGVAVARVEAVDVLQRREAELARKSAILAGTLDNTVQAISMFDAAQRLVAFNRRYVELISLPVEFLATEPTLRDILVRQVESGDVPPPEWLSMPQDKEAIVEYWIARAPPPDEPYTYERERPDGSVVEVYSNPLPDGGFIRVITDVTERRRNEVLMREALADTASAEAKLREILASLPVGVLVLDEKANIEIWNEAYSKYTGVPGSILEAHRDLDANSRYIYEHYPHRRDMPLDQFIAERRKRMLADTFLVREVAFKDPRYDIQYITSPLKSGGAVNVIVDISPQKEAAREALRARAEAEAAEAKVRDILESLPVGVLVLDEQRGIVMWNEAYVKYTGIPAKVLDAHRDIDDNSRYIYANYPHMRTMPVEQFVAERRQRMFVEGFSVREVTFENPHYDIQYIIAPLKTGGAVNVIVDITSQKEAQRDVLKAIGRAEAIQSQLRAILNHLPIGVVVFDGETNIRYWNRKFVELTGTDEEAYSQVKDLDELCAHTYSKFPNLHTMPLADFTRSWARRIFGGETAPREFEFRELSLMTLQVVAALPEGGRMLVVVDITKQKDSERQALRARKDAEDANLAKSQFLAAMSHEIRTPMNGVLGMLELLKSTRLDAEQSEMVSVVRESANSLLKIIDDILDFSKIEAGKIEIEEVELSPLQVGEGVAETLTPEARRKEIAVVTFVDPAVPDLLAGDAVRLRQILFNLVGNAIKFTQHGEVSIAVRIAAEDTTSVTLRFEVADTGIGLTDDQIARLFQPFMQGDRSTTRRFGGTGLGLSISKRLVELMQGEISVASEPGQGSTFSFTARLARRPAKAVAGKRPLQGQRLLIVDDSPMVRDLVRRYATEAGAETTTADTAGGAMAELARAARAGRPYQAAILDMRLPDGDGWTLGRDIREASALAQTRLVLLTAFDEPDHRRRALAQGFSAYLTKPIRRTLLLSALVPAVDKETAAKAEESAAPTSDALILVAEDNPTNRTVIAKQLKKLGYRHEIFADGRAALNAYDSGRHALVLTDCHMPVMDGFALTNALRDAEKRTGKRVPIVALTANALQGEAEKCFAAGMDDYIAKPASLAQLSSVLRKWTANASAPAAPAAPPAGEVPIFDTSILDELFEDSTEERRSFLDVFATSVEQMLAALPAALDRDREEARGLAHSIKGAARSAGAMRVGRAAEALEGVLKVNDETLEPLAALLSAFAEARREIEKR